jgi:hypothetical protein
VPYQDFAYLSIFLFVRLQEKTFPVYLILEIHILSDLKISLLPYQSPS